MHALSEDLTHAPITQAAAEPRLKLRVQCTVLGASVLGAAEAIRGG